MSMRKGASVSQLFAERRFPVAARILRLLSKRFMADLPGVIDTADENVFQEGAYLVSPGLVNKGGWPIAAGHTCGLIDISATREFHLNRMNPAGRLAIMARRPAAAKAPVRDMAECRSAATRLYVTDKANARRAAIVGSYVQIGQRAS